MEEVSLCRALSFPWEDESLSLSLEKESLSLPSKLFQPPGRPTRNQSNGLRKSVNWARPVATTSVQNTTVKRSSTRLSGKDSAGSNPCIGSIEIERIHSPEEKRPTRVISCVTRRSGNKHEALAASSTEPQDSNHCSKEESNLQAHKRARIDRSGKDQLDGNDCIEAGKSWVSVPLDSSLEGQEDLCRNQHYMDSEADESPLRPSNKDSTEATEAHRSVASCSFNTEWKENPEPSKENLDVEELCEFLTGARKVVHFVEHLINKMRENELKTLREENARVLEMAVLEHERHSNEISELSQKTSRIMEEKLTIERERDDLQNDFSEKLERSREALRLEMEREHADTLANLRKELGKEQDKTCCQICFTSPRDAIVLPCMHFHYCSDCLQEHQKRQKGCPTCRAKINGVLRCDLCTT